MSQITAGNLPGPQYDNAGNDLTEYAIYFPPGANITDPGGAQSCVEFCAYHGTGTFNSKDLVYGIFPDVYTGGCSSGCGSSSLPFNNLTSVSSHELAEVVTDVAVGLAGGFAPPLAWYDAASGTGEIGDICNAQQASISTPQGTYTIQKLWSNAEAACVSSGLHPSYNLSAPGTATQGTSLSFTLTAQNPSGGKSTDTAYVGTVHFTSSDGASGVVLPADFTFDSSNQGTASFSATLQTLGSQSITATDTVNSAITATASVTVSAPTTVQVTVGTSPAGLSFSVDGTPYTTPQTLTWTIGTMHTIATTTPQTPSAGVQNTFSSWSDGGAISHSVTAPGSTTTYTANFNTAYLLTTAANPSIGGTVAPPSGTYYAAGANVSLTATANPGYAFSGWTGNVANANSASTTVTMNAPQTVTANFNPTSPTTTSLMSSPDPSTFGQSVTFTATVTPTLGGTPTGTITFTADGSNVLGTSSLSGGQAALSVSSLGAGNHSIVASYGGDSADQASTSSQLMQTVKTASTTTGLTSSLNPAAVGQTITYTATVTSQYLGVVTGSVTFKAGATALGSATLVNGQASINTSFSTSGTRYITATYVGDVNNAGSKSLSLQQLVNKAVSSTALVSDINPSDYAQLVTFTALL